MKLVFSQHIFYLQKKKKLKYQIFIKINPVGTELFMGTNGRTDRHDGVNSRFSKFCERAMSANQNT